MTKAIDNAREQEDVPPNLRTLPITAAAVACVLGGDVGIDGGPAGGGLTERDGVIDEADRVSS